MSGTEPTTPSLPLGIRISPFTISTPKFPVNQFGNPRIVQMTEFEALFIDSSQYTTVLTVRKSVNDPLY
jgi:hypothetical protein